MTPYQASRRLAELRGLRPKPTMRENLQLVARTWGSNPPRGEAADCIQAIFEGLFPNDTYGGYVDIGHAVCVNGVVTRWDDFLRQLANP